MAMNYLEEQKKKQQQEMQQTGGYNLQGTSAATQQQLQKAQQGYQPSQQAQQAQQNLQTIQNQKPQSYASKYGPQLESILQQIQNPNEFKYEFNGDENFKYLADLYTQNAKKANINAQGQAAALTGGYGNSYGAAAGAQAYQEALLPLYQQGMQLRQQAMDQYNADRADRYNQLAAVQGMDESDYGRYQDTVQNWRADLQNAQDMYNTERNFAYNEYTDALQNAMNLANMETSSYRADQDEAYRRDSLAQNQAQFEATNKLDWVSLEEKQRQFDAELTEDQRQYNQKMAASWVADILANGQIPSNELLVAAGLSLEDAQKLVAQLTTGGGGGPDNTRTTKETVAQAIGNIGTLSAMVPAALDPEGSAKEAANTANTYANGTKERADWEEIAKVYSQISKANDEARAAYTPSSGNMTAAEIAAYKKALEEAKIREQGIKKTVKSK